jgi:hypothetical protein
MERAEMVRRVKHGVLKMHGKAAERVSEVLIAALAELKAVGDALQTDETGEALVSVARTACEAEHKLANLTCRTCVIAFAERPQCRACEQDGLENEKERRHTVDAILRCAYAWLDAKDSGEAETRLRSVLAQHRDARLYETQMPAEQVDVILCKLREHGLDAQMAEQMAEQDSNLAGDVEAVCGMSKCRLAAVKACGDIATTYLELRVVGSTVTHTPQQEEMKQARMADVAARLVGVIEKATKDMRAASDEAVQALEASSENEGGNA